MFKKISDFALPTTNMIVKIKTDNKFADVSSIAYFNVNTKKFYAFTGEELIFGSIGREHVESWCEVNPTDPMFSSEKEYAFRKDLMDVLFKHDASIECDYDSTGNPSGDICINFNYNSSFTL